MEENIKEIPYGVSNVIGNSAKDSRHDKVFYGRKIWKPLV